MRSLWLFAIPVFFGACSVKVIGAPCNGEDNCPLDQRCEIPAGASEGHCAACQPDPECDDAELGIGFCSEDGNSVKVCGTNAGSCRFSLTTESCDSASPCTTDAPDGLAHCKCLPNSGSEFYADPRGSAPDAAPYATGASASPRCRFGTLGAAVAAASAYTGPATVIAAGDGTNPQTFDHEALPIDIPSTVTLKTEPENRPDLYAIQLDGSASAAITLQSGASVSGFSVINAGDASGVGISAQCSGGQVSLASMMVQGHGGTASLAKGIDVGAQCSATFGAVDVSGSGIGVAVGSGGSATFHGANVHENGTGIQVTGTGNVVVDGASQIAVNTGWGIDLQGGSVKVAGTNDQRVDVGGNGAGGIRAGVTGNPCALDVSYANVHDNGAGSAGSGILIPSNTDFNALGHPMTISNSSFTGNAEAGIKVQDAAVLCTAGADPLCTWTSSQLASGSYSVGIDGCTFDGEKHGVELLTNTSIWASLRNNTIKNGTDTGLMVSVSIDSGLEMVGNVITKNRASTNWGTTVARYAGGIYVAGGNPHLVFDANQIYANTGGDQILIISIDSWDLSSTGVSAATANTDCLTKANIIACHDKSGGWVPLRFQGSPISSFTASYDRWPEDMPTVSSVVLSSGMKFVVGGVCPAVPVDFCPP